MQIELGDTKSCNQLRDEVSIGCLSKTTKQLASSFSLQYHPYIKQKGYQNKGNDHHFKKLQIVKQILLVSTKGI